MYCLTMNEYYPRIADKILQEELSGIGAVLLEGPKWCGKHPLQSR